MNSRIYFFSFYELLWFTLGLYILRTLRYLMKSGSIRSIETTNSQFWRISFLILFFFFFFFHVFVKHKRDLRLKYVLLPLFFCLQNFIFSTYDNIVYNNVKLCNRLQFYSPDYIRTCNELHEACLLSQFCILTISKAINNDKSFYRLILILPGDISPGLV